MPETEVKDKPETLNGDAPATGDALAAPETDGLPADRQGKPPEQVASDAEPGEGAEPGATEPSWWSTAEDEESLWGHENAGRKLTETREEALQTARQEMQPRVDATNAHLSKLRGTLDGFWQSFNDLVESAKNDPDQTSQISDIVKQHKDAFNALSGVNWDDGYQAALIGYRQGDDRVLGVLEALLGSKGAAEPFIQRSKNVCEFGTKDNKFYADLRKTLAAAEVKATLEAERKKLETEIRAQVEEELRAKARKEKGNPAVPEGGGGGSTSDKWATKAEARTLHVQKKISHAEMRRINADPSIPE